MNREEFMKRLADLLSGLPYEERREALDYYENYFEDAGMEHEMDVIDELISPEHVAVEILRGEKKSFQEEAASEQAKPVQDYQQPEYAGAVSEKKKSWVSRHPIWTFVIAIVTSPFWISVLAVAIGVLAAVAGLLIGLLFIGFGILAIGIVRIATIPSAGVFLLGISLGSIGLFIVCVCLLILLIQKLVAHRKSRKGEQI